MIRRPSFSIIINTLNRDRYLENTLQSLRYIRYPMFEVIVVNGPSTDNTESVLLDNVGFVRSAVCPAANLSQSRNIGIEIANGDIVAFLDDDAIPEPDWLDRLARAYADPDVGGAGGPVRHDDGITYQQHVVVSDHFTENEFFSSVEEAARAGALTRGFMRPMGANASFRRDALLEIGGFDEVFAYYADEVDVSLRLIEKGWRIVHMPDAEVHHKTAASHLRNEQRIPSDLYVVSRSKAYFCWRHGSKCHTPGEVLAEISRWRREHAGYLSRLLQGDAINQQRADKLAGSMDRGILDGMNAALTDAPRTRDFEKKSRGSYFVASLPKLPADKRLRLCFVSADFPPAHVGGVARYTAVQARALAALGHEVSVVTRAVGMPRIDFEDGVWVHRVVQYHPGNRLPQSFPPIPAGLEAYISQVRQEVLRIHLQRGVDIVCSSIWNVEGLGCAGIPELKSAVTLVTSHNLVARDRPDWQDVNFRNQSLYPMVRAENWLVEKADLIIGSTRSIVEDISSANSIEISPRKSIVVPFGIPDRISGRAIEPAVSNGEVRLLFVGRYEPRKGIDLLLDALARLLPVIPELVVDLVGDDKVPFPGGAPIWERFEGKHRNAPWLSRIWKLGVLSDDAVEECYGRCDIFIAPSRYESFGLIYLEAMREGKPVIACDSGGCKEIVQDGQTGFLIPKNDVDAIVGAITRLVQDKELRKRMGYAARQDFLRRFTDVEMARQLSLAFGKLLNAA